MAAVKFAETGIHDESYRSFGVFQSLITPHTTACSFRAPALIGAGVTRAFQALNGQVTSVYPNRGGGYKVVLMRLCLRLDQNLLYTHICARDLQDLLNGPDGLFHVRQCPDATGARGKIESQQREV